MASLQLGNFVTLANRFDFSKYKTVLDVGGANAQLSRALAGRHPHLSLLSYLPALHDWNEDARRKLIAKAYASLPAGGALIAIESVIDDARRQNAFGLLMSLNMLIEFGADGGFDYTGAQYDGWCREAGFSHTEFYL